MKLLLSAVVLSYLLPFISNSRWPVKRSQVHSLSLAMTWMPLQLSSVTMPHFVFQLTNPLSKLHDQQFWCVICSSPPQLHSWRGGGCFLALLSLPHLSILSSAAQLPGWAPWTHPPGPQGVWQKYPQLLQLLYETGILHLPPCSPCDAVVISTKTDDFCPSQFLDVVKVVCEQSSNGEGGEK